MSTSIEWTDETWNPVSGCTRVSQGCKHCYAERVFPRVYAKDGRAFTDVRMHPDRLEWPLHWRKPRRVFVNSMSDLFHEAVPPSFIHRTWLVMCGASQHQFQILTKRPQRMRSILTSAAFAGFEAVPNIWLGVSIEDQATADERIPLLLQTPAAVRFVSYEPALGPVDLAYACFNGADSFGQMPGLDWVIVGGESGPKARPCNIGWIRSIVQQCKAASVPVFVKQLGANVRDWCAGIALGDEPESEYPLQGFCDSYEAHEQSDTCEGFGVGCCEITGKGGDPSEWPPDLRVREWPSR